MTFASIDDTTKDDFHYLSVPLKGCFNFGNKIYGFLNLGIVPSILLYAQSINKYHRYPRYPTLSGINRTIQYNRFDLAGLYEMGMGYKIKNKFSIYTSIVFQGSITAWWPGLRHNGRTLSLGIKYALKK